MKMILIGTEATKEVHRDKVEGMRRGALRWRQARRGSAEVEAEGHGSKSLYADSAGTFSNTLGNFVLP